MSLFKTIQTGQGKRESRSCCPFKQDARKPLDEIVMLLLLNHPFRIETICSNYSALSFKSNWLTSACGGTFHLGFHGNKSQSDKPGCQKKQLDESLPGNYLAGKSTVHPNTHDNGHRFFARTSGYFSGFTPCRMSLRGTCLLTERRHFSPLWVDIRTPCYFMFVIESFVSVIPFFVFGMRAPSSPVSSLIAGQSCVAVCVWLEPPRAPLSGPIWTRD